MVVSHAPSSSLSSATASRSELAVQRARELLASHREPSLAERFGLTEFEAEAEADALATALMDLFRRSRDADVFETLVALRRDALLRRIRGRVRYLGAGLDADEVLQDVLVNVYRYPDRFDASRPAAFRAWSATIVDNSIRRKLRRRSGPDVILQPSEDLCREHDRRAVEPADRAADAEACRNAADAIGLLLRAYLLAYQELNERERFVLQMVEVEGMRYAQIAEMLGVRPEALKMVVFRARRRIQDKLTVMFARIGASPVTDAAA